MNIELTQLSFEIEIQKDLTVPLPPHLQNPTGPIRKLFQLVSVSKTQET